MGYTVGMNRIILANERAAQCWAFARKRWPSLPGLCPPVRINYRLRTTAGQAFSSGDRYGICLAAKIIDQHGWGGFHYETIPHEVAHIVADLVLESKGHDEAWRTVMRYFGLKPWRCWSVERMKYWQAKYAEKHP